MTVLALLCGLSGLAIAQDDLLVERLPPSLAPGRVFEIARASLVARGWQVLSFNGASMISEYDGAKLRLFIAGDALRYQVMARAAPRLISELRSDLLTSFDASRPPPATGRILIASIAPDKTEAEVLQAARAALVRRRWTLLPAPENVARARLTRSEGIGVDASVSLFMAGGKLHYVERGAPDRWIENLRADVSRLLHTRPVREAPAGEATRAPSPSGRFERLKTLKQLLDSGMITSEEYENKRAAILKDL